MTYSGFREVEIAEMAVQIVRECDLSQSTADEMLSMMRTFYNGYRFSRRAKEPVYNPALALYFLEEFQRECRYPDEILDSNLAIDRGKMHYISQLPKGRELIFDALTEKKPVRVRRLADRFGVEDMLHARKDTGFVASLLYYFGILTLGGMTPFGELILRIPNLVIRKLYAEQIQEMLLPEGEAKLDGKILGTMDRKALRALPAVQARQREAEAGLARYREKLERKFGDLLRLHSFGVIAVGFERLVFS